MKKRAEENSMKFVKKLDENFYYVLDKKISVTSAELYEDGNYFYEHLKLSDGSQQVEKFYKEHYEPRN